MVVQLIAKAAIPMLALVAVTSPTVAQSTLNTAFTYQGELIVDGAPLDGNNVADIQAILWDAASGGQPIGAPVVVPNLDFDQGRFTITLDFGQSPFGGGPRWLQLAVRQPAGSANDFVELWPRQAITAAPYALYALEGAGGETLWQVTGDDIFYTAGRVGVGTPSPDWPLDVTGVTKAVRGRAIFKQGTTYGGYFLSESPSGIGVYGEASNDSGTNYGVYGATNSPDGFAVYGTTGSPGAFAGYFSGVGLFTGRLGVGQMMVERPSHMLTVRGPGTEFGGAAGYPEVVAYFLQTDPTQHSAISIDAQPGQDAMLRLCEGSHSYWNIRHNAQSSIGDHILSMRYLPYGATDGTTVLAIEPEDGAGNTAVRINAFSGHDPVLHFCENQSAIWSLRNDATDNHFEIRYQGNPKLTVAPSGETKVESLTITGGSDLAEPFTVTRADDQDGQIQPGMVVAIDAEHPGQLKLATAAYDRKVAGVVSGANGLKPGMMMKAEGTVHADGDLPVALSGRVWCWCDASGGAIEPGDLLTTSDTPGHARKVTDYPRAQGAIIGKAMTPLTEGRGLVLVLVNLQ